MEGRQLDFAIQGSNLSKRFRMGDATIRALDDVSIDVVRGEFLSVMGPSGSGKSTLLHLLGLLDDADAGEVRILGQSAAGLDDEGKTLLRRHRLGFLFQSFNLIPNLSAAENILLPAELAGSIDRGRTRLAELSHRLGIADRLDHRPRQLSGGQRQRVALARALINDPAVVLADEPTGNLDTRTGGEVLSLLKRGVDELGWTVIMVTHDPNAALVAHRIVFLRDGGVSGEVRTDESDVRDRIEVFAGV